MRAHLPPRNNPLSFDDSGSPVFIFFFSVQRGAGDKSFPPTSCWDPSYLTEGPRASVDPPLYAGARPPADGVLATIDPPGLATTAWAFATRPPPGPVRHRPRIWSPIIKHTVAAWEGPACLPALGCSGAGDHRSVGAGWPLPLITRARVGARGRGHGGPSSAGLLRAIGRRLRPGPFWKPRAGSPMGGGEVALARKRAWSKPPSYSLGLPAQGPPS